ncbi:MAG: hypothetical protein U1F81_18645 [Verrucomicrobiaceae bacterium]
MKLCLLALSITAGAVYAQGLPLEQQLERLPVSQTFFHEIELTDFAEELRHLSQRPATGDKAASSINFVLLASSKETFSMPSRDLSLRELLQLGCEAFKVKAVFEPHAVLIVPLDHAFINPLTDAKDAKGQEAIWRRRYKPTVQFEDVSIEEACEYLGTSIRSVCDPPLDQVPFNLVLKSTADASSRKLSIDVRAVPIHDALRYIGELSGLELRYHANAVVLSPPGDRFIHAELPRHSAAKQRADKIVLPTVEFVDASLEDVVSFVRLKSKQLDPSGKDVPIVVKPGLKASKHCDLSLRSMNVSEVLRYAAALMEVKLTADDQSFIFAEQ